MIRSRKLPLFLGLLLLVWILAPRAAQVYVEALWFGSLTYSAVFWYALWMKFGLFVGFFALTFGLLRGSLWAIERAFSQYILGGTILRFDNQPVEMEPEKFMKPLAWSVAVFWSLLSGISMGTRWELFALGFNSAAGNTATGASLDPIFHKPVSFFLFQWPVLQVIASWLTGIAFIVLLATLLYGFFVYMSHMPEILKREAKHTAAIVCSFALGALLLVYAWRFSLARFSQVWRDHDVFTGIGYTQQHIILPGLVLVAITLVVAAAVAILNAFVWRQPRLLLVALGIPVVSYLGFALVSNYVDNFIVKPNQIVLQAPYIKHNIEGTRRGFGLDSLTVRDFPSASGVQAFDLDKATNQVALENIRLWDWQALLASLRQGQALGTYYDFSDVDVDRYMIGGQKRQVMIAAREFDINRQPEASRNWVNDRLVYTHGYGVTVNTTDGFTREGRPRFLLSDMPVKSTVPDLKLTRPEIYFGQRTDEPVYVNTRQREFDHPQGGSNTYTTYKGTGGVNLGGSIRRLLISWVLGDLSKIPFSSDVTPESRVLLHRNIRERVERIAPFLTYDDDPYIVIGNDGHLYWMIDAYTTSLYYPYSSHYRTGDGWANYMRNSVKVVIDAYNGTTDFYVFDPKDPVVNAYRGAFPTLFKDASAMPASLREHVRYPEQLLQTQAEVYGLYHMKDAESFFSREDVWSVAGENVAATSPLSQLPPGLMPPSQAVDQPLSRSGAPDSSPVEQPFQPIDPYYVLMPLPGEKQGAEFVEILPFTLKQKNLVGWMAGRSDGAAYGTLFAYHFPRSTPLDAPALIKGRIDQNSELSEKFSLWDRQGSKVLRNNMMVIPLGRGVLYVEPVFLKADKNPTPELRLVVLATQDRIAYGTTFREALAKLLGSGDLPADDVEPSSGQASTPVKAPSGAVGGTSPAAVKPNAGAATERPSGRQQLIDQAASDFDAYQRLMAQGRYSEAGQKLEGVRKALEQLRKSRE